MNWVFEHSQDPDFATPLQTSVKSDSTADPESIAMIQSMGFTEDQARKALLKNVGS